MGDHPVMKMSTSRRQLIVTLLAMSNLTAGKEERGAVYVRFLAPLIEGVGASSPYQFQWNAHQKGRGLWILILRLSGAPDVYLRDMPVQQEQEARWTIVPVLETVGRAIRRGFQCLRSIFVSLFGIFFENKYEI